ncbi:hypothetical protein ACQ4PT_006341 [Festuca glaucescens]
MRIRRYAARLLASSAASSPPPPPDAGAAAPWLHAAADDCAFCELTRGSDPQVAPDGIKHKGHIHIASPEPEAESETDDLAQPPPAPQELIPAQRCEIDREHSTREDAAGLEATGGAAASPESQAAPDGIKHKGHIAGSEPQGELKSDGHAGLPPQPHAPKESIPAQRCEMDYEQSASGDAAGIEVTGRAAAKPEYMEETTLASELATEPAVKRGAFVVDVATGEQEAGGTSPLVNGSVAEPEATGGVSLVSGSIAGPEVTMGVPSAGEAAAEREVSEGVSLASGSIAEPEFIMGACLAGKAVAERQVSEGVSLASGLTAELEVIRGAAFADEAVAEREVYEGVSLESGSVAEPQVTRGASLADRKISGGFSLVSEATTEAAAVVTALGVTTGAPLDTEGIAEPDCKTGASPVDESAAEIDKMEASSVNEAAAEMDKMEASSVNESAAEMDVTRPGSFVIEAATDPGLPERVSLPNEAATEREVSEGVSPASETAAEPADVVTVLKVTTGTPLHDEGVADTDIEMGASSVNEYAAGMDFTPLCSLVTEAATHPGLPELVPLANENATDRVLTAGVILVTETATESPDVVTALGVTTGSPIDNQGIPEPDIKMEARPVNESSAEMDVIRLDSHVIEAAADPGHSEGVSLANKTTTEREVSEGVSLVTEAATEPADVVTALEVTTGAPLDNAGAAVPETKMEASLVNESTTEMDCVRLGSPTIEATTHPGLAERVSLVSKVITETGVTGAANLDTEVSVEPEATGGPSLVNESTELEITEGVSIAKEAAAEPEVIGEAYVCSEDADAALNKTQPLDCDLDCATVQVENAGVSVRDEVQPSRDDAADEVVSVSSTSTGPDKSPTADEVTPHDDTPSVSCVSGIVARSVGKSGRTDIICYARRSGKRKLDMAEMKTEQIEMGDGDIYDQCEEKATLDKTAPCESAMSTAGSVEIKLADIKRDLAGNSASSRCKRRKGRYECDIDYCRMTFKKKAELSVHKKNMCTVKSCGKHFRSHKYLRRHQSIHNEDTPYKCPWEDCSMAFKWTWSLADHFQVHTGEKPYRCRSPGCSKIYKYVSDFIRHKKRCKPQR